MGNDVQTADDCELIVKTWVRVSDEDGNKHLITWLDGSTDHFCTAEFGALSEGSNLPAYEVDVIVDIPSDIESRFDREALISFNNKLCDIIKNET